MPDVATSFSFSRSTSRQIRCSSMCSRLYVFPHRLVCDQACFTDTCLQWDSVDKSAIQEKKIRVNWLPAMENGHAGPAVTPVRHSLANGVRSLFQMPKPLNFCWLEFLTTVTGRADTRCAPASLLLPKRKQHFGDQQRYYSLGG